MIVTRDDPRPHPRPEPDDGDPGVHRRGPRAVRDADLRPAPDGPGPGRTWWTTTTAVAHASNPSDFELQMRTFRRRSRLSSAQVAAPDGRAERRARRAPDRPTASPTTCRSMLRRVRPAALGGRPRAPHDAVRRRDGRRRAARCCGSEARDAARRGARRRGRGRLHRRVGAARRVREGARRRVAARGRAGRPLARRRHRGRVHPGRDPPRRRGGRGGRRRRAGAAAVVLRGRSSRRRRSPTTTGAWPTRARSR